MAPKKKKEKEEVKEVESEYASMDLEMLREVVPMLRQQLEKAMLDRNYVQLERVSILSYTISITLTSITYEYRHIN